MIATLRFLHPELAEWALLVFSALNKFLESLISQVGVLADLVFLACLANVEWGTAVQAVSFLAYITGEIGAIPILIINKGVLAVGTRAPGNVILKANSLLE